ncbi:hypothetical protein [Nocardioides sp. NPDC127503]|uniref:hypothetical protein n=1 Tax=Nocardioides sp. NPDC127503 TaxID=3154516 RepID=UPI003322EFE6
MGFNRTSALKHKQKLVGAIIASAAVAAAGCAVAMAQSSTASAASGSSAVAAAAVAAPVYAQSVTAETAVVDGVVSRQIADDDIKPIEAEMANSTARSAYKFGADRIVVSRATNGLGESRTVFSRMVYEPDLQEWYAEEAVDRPVEANQLGFTWARFELPSGDQVFVWDGKPVGSDLYVGMAHFSGARESGAAIYNELVMEGEVGLG